MAELIIKIIRVYQVLSCRFLELRPPIFFTYTVCRHYPTCSDYAIGAIEKYGPGLGLIKAFGRISRCISFSRGRLIIDEP